MTVTSPAVRVVSPGSFEPDAHYYPRVLNAQIHPMVRFFLAMSRERLVSRYCHLHPRVDAEALQSVLRHPARHLRWAGCDLMHVTNAKGHRSMVVIETNSSPSGQKSMPLFDDQQEQGGYRVLMERTVLPLLRKGRLPKGGLAVLWDKNPMECSGYAAALADLTGEDVFLVPFFEDEADPAARFRNGLLEVRDEAGAWRPIRFAMRYVTQRPWNRIPVHTRTEILNPVLACLSGGRNKMVAAKAYDLFNADLTGTGLEIHTPKTIWDVGWHEIPLWVRRLGGHAVVKVPYSNAGQGVTTITSEAELEAFREAGHHYDKFIVQSLIGNYRWSSRTTGGRLYHVGTVPNRDGEIYVADLRVMISSGEDGYRPLVVYARRAREPLRDELQEGASSWDMLGTNLSIKSEQGWDTETQRLLLMDQRDFNKLGIGIDDLIEAYIQTVLSSVAIDRMAAGLVGTKGRFRMRLFQSLDDDPALLAEILK